MGEFGVEEMGIGVGGESGLYRLNVDEFGGGERVRLRREKGIGEAGGD